MDNVDNLVFAGELVNYQHLSFLLGSLLILLLLSSYPHIIIERQRGNATISFTKPFIHYSLVYHIHSENIFIECTKSNRNYCHRLYAIFSLALALSVPFLLFLPLALHRSHLLSLYIFFTLLPLYSLLRPLTRSLSLYRSFPLSHSSKALINTAIIKSCSLLLFKTFNGYVYPFIEIRYKKQTQRIHLLRMARFVTMEMKNYFMFLYDVFILVNFSPTV